MNLNDEIPIPRTDEEIMREELTDEELKKIGIKSKILALENKAKRQYLEIYDMDFLILEGLDGDDYMRYYRLKRKLGEDVSKYIGEDLG